MSHSNHVLRGLCLGLLAALGLTAFVAASAQAQTGWLLNGSFITVTKEISAQIHPLKGTGVKDGTLDTELPATGAIKIKCKKLAITDGLIFAGEKAEGLGTLNFTECATEIKEKATAACNPKEPIVAKTQVPRDLTYHLR